MIKSPEQAVAVQSRRRESGKKGRSKAVRRWFKANYGPAVEAGGALTHDLAFELRGNFTGCRRHDEVHR